MSLTLTGALRQAQDGDTIECVQVHSSEVDYFTKGKSYPVVKHPYGCVIEDDEGDEWCDTATCNSIFNLISASAAVAAVASAKVKRHAHAVPNQYGNGYMIADKNILGVAYAYPFHQLREAEAIARDLNDGGSNFRHASRYICRQSKNTGHMDDWMQEVQRSAPTAPTAASAAPTAFTVEVTVYDIHLQIARIKIYDINGVQVCKLGYKIPVADLPYILQALEVHDWLGAENMVRASGSVHNSWARRNKHGWRFDVNNASCAPFMASTVVATPTHDDDVDALSYANNEPDSWDELATGGRVKANTDTEWTPDVIGAHIDTTKKISDW